MYQIPLCNDLIVDNFAGGGGASCGLEIALRRPVNIAINHDPEAVAMHTVNHPLTEHFCEDVWEINPVKVCKGRSVALAWFSPDCKHFSKAKGGRPVEKKIRGLAWVVLRWAATVKPRIIMLENVEEFTTWGPVIDGQPDPKQKGKTFKSFVRALERQGYVVEWRELRASDYGAPTIRKRLFLVARNDGNLIVWPKVTHGDPRKVGFKQSGLKPWRTAAECIDWDIPAPSIFTRTRPLAENTLKRVAKGFRRFVIDADSPFIVPVCHGEAPGQEARTHDINAPLPTITAKGKHALISPFVARHFGQSIGASIDVPVGTVTAGGAGKTALITPYLTEHANSSNPRVFAADEPLRTQCAQIKGGHFAMCMPFLAKHFGGVVGVPADTPMPTITTRGTQTQMVAAYVNKLRSDNVGHGADEPLHTVSASGTHHALTTAYMVKYYGNEKEGHGLNGPCGTVTTKDRFGLVQVEALTPENLCDEQRYSAWWTVRFLEDYGVIPKTASGPRPSLFMLGDWIVWDIGMRMFSPRELFRAQGFPETYIIDRTADGKPITKTQQVHKCGNSVSPIMSAVLSAANMEESMFMKQNSDKGPGYEVRFG